MKNILHKKLLISFTAILFSVFLLGSGSAFAAERVWTGEGSDNKFSTAENWEDDTAPVDGDSITFPKAAFPDIEDCATPQDIVENDLDPETVTLAGLSIGASGESMTGGCSAGQTGGLGLKITGNDLVLSGDIVDNLNHYRNEVNAGIIATADILVKINQLSSDISIGTHTVTLEGTNTISLTGTILGEGTLDIRGYVNYNSSADSPDFTGTITVSEDANFSMNRPLPNAAIIVINGGGLDLYASTPNQISVYSGPDIEFNGGELAVSGHTTGTVDLQSDVTVTAATTIKPYSSLKFTGTVEGKQHFAVEAGLNGSVTWPDGSITGSVLKTTVVNGDNKNTYCYESPYGLYVARNNRYMWNVDCPERGTENFGSISGILAGIGTIGNVKIMDGGVISPGQSPGVLSTGSLEFEEGGIYEFEIAGAEAGQYDQINVTGTVSLGDGTLSVLPLDGFTPGQGQSLVIINNDGDDAVEGTFAGLAEGAAVEVNGQPWFTISYVGGDGNDVVLTTIPGVGNAGQSNSVNLAAYLLVSAVGAGLLYTQRKKLSFSKKRR